MQNKLDLYQKCHLCPHQCGINRYLSDGFCGAPAQPKIAKIMLHFWEEPCISGSQGSGTVFFSHCNLKCCYCQNFLISHLGKGEKVPVDDLVNLFLSLQNQGAHNINLVSPTPYLPSVVDALTHAKERGLSIPVIYNTSAYELPHNIELLQGLVDIYLPDLKYAEQTISKNLSGISDYFEQATSAILKMYHQVGPTTIDENGLIKSGILIRHLILPSQLENSQKVLDWIASNLPKSVFISLMSQYFPSYQAATFPNLNRRLTAEEYEKVIDYFFDIGLENGYMQELDSATEIYVPDF